MPVGTPCFPKDATDTQSSTTTWGRKIEILIARNQAGPQNDGMNTAPPIRCNFLLLLATVVFLSSCGKPQAEIGNTNDEAIGLKPEVIRVFVEIKFKNRAEDRSLEIECGAESSVFAATLQALGEHDIAFDYSGDDGPLAFVDAIGGIVNEKSAGDNWLYRVNDELGKVGCGVAELAEGDQITWSFGKYQPEN